MIDISKCKVNEQRLNMIDNILNNSKDIIYYYQVLPERKFIYLSKSVEVVLGHSLDLNYQNPLYVFENAHPDDVLKLERKASGEMDYSKSVITRWKHKDGNYLWMEDYPIPIYDEGGNLIGVQGICRDISEKVELEQKLKYLISHDVFTGLRNRAYFDEQLKMYNNTKNTPIGLIICDLDNLKVINDSFGHDRGDLLIKSTSALLLKLSDENKVIARLGGDEFGIIIKNTSEFDVIDICKKLNTIISIYNTENKNFPIKLSIGHAFSETSLNAVDDVFKRADANMYIDKKRSK
ncbi:sensor domain-containing diguanylate cyclase [Clostridium algidicarnis]|uniref:sensor domain-containing diguanylate cyclase n=1 Tax=Clostridium algidicarnis TaxID=37659 RepID=UPI0016273E4E|nr:sensor domain-containing diguanylate cyclase [Clostridium algidicarnis]MBB6698653.1 GGDEF domain-containing protein [Clostridium algidicarnis]